MQDFEMITSDKIKVYSKYNGDPDGFARTNRKKDIGVIEEGDWKVIDSFIQDLGLIQRDLVSDEYKRNFEERFQRLTDQEKTRIKLRELSSKLY